MNMRSVGSVLAMFTLLLAGAARAQDAHEDLSACPGSAPEPTQSALWSVAFCNRTGHDVVIEFHDNDCPARDWSRRGDVYQRTLRRDESKSLPLCYANEPAGKKIEPGTPVVRLPGGKGVVTTWSVVGDCGDRSKTLSVDARTFYDRGDYKTGIILLQYPTGASHCTAESSTASSATSSTALSAAGAATASAPIAATATAGAAGAANAATTAGSASTSTASARSTAPPGAASAAPVVAAPAPTAPAAAPAVNNRGNGAPTLTATIDPKDVIGRSVRVFATDGAGYNCRFTLALTFSDGATWNDKTKVDIAAGDANAPIITRKYLKTVTNVQITSPSCTPK